MISDSNRRCGDQLQPLRQGHHPLEFGTLSGAGQPAAVYFHLQSEGVQGNFAFLQHNKNERCNNKNSKTEVVNKKLVHT
jgi:hypothetical protein